MGKKTQKILQKNGILLKYQSEAEVFRLCDSVGSIAAVAKK